MGNLTIFTDRDPETVYPSQEVVWGRFEQAFLALLGLVTYAPVFRDYYYQGLSEFYMDNVMYLELRALLPEVHWCNISDVQSVHSWLWSFIYIRNCCCFFGSQIYELDGSTHDTAWTLKTYQDVTRQFTAEHPDFLGARIIFTYHRWPVWKPLAWIYRSVWMAYCLLAC